MDLRPYLMLLYMAILIGLPLFVSRASRKHGKPPWMFWRDFGFGSIAGGGCALFFLAILSGPGTPLPAGDIWASYAGLFNVIVGTVVGGSTWGWMRSRR